MEGIKYDSIYKFIVSIGIMITILPIVILIFIIKNSDVVFITEYEISKLTTTSQEIIKIEQELIYFLLKNTKITITIILTFFLIGIGLIIYGLVEWKNKVQKHEDKSIELSNKFMEEKIKSLSHTEKEEKLIKEINTDNQLETNIIKDNKSISKYMEIQENIYNAIEKIFNKYKIFREVKIEEKYYDCIALGKDNSIYDYLFEIKYFSTLSAIKGKIEEIITKSEKLELEYYKSSRRYPRMVLILIVDKFSDKDQLEGMAVLNKIEEEKEKHSMEIIISNVNNISDKLKKVRKV